MIQYTLTGVYMNTVGIPGIPKGTAVMIIDTCRENTRPPYTIKPTRDLAPTDRILVRSDAGFLAWVDAQHLEMENPL